jgi:hypothetical protein
MSSSDFSAATKRMIISYRCNPFGRVQGKFYELRCLHSLNSNTHWYALLVQRISDFGYATTVLQASSFIENVNTALKANPPQSRSGAAMMYIKTRTNSCCASRHLAKAGVRKLNYIFGCEDCADDLSHYLQCHVIWCLVCSAMKLDKSWAALDGIDRVGFPDPDAISIYSCANIITPFVVTTRPFLMVALLTTFVSRKS